MARSLRRFTAQQWADLIKEQQAACGVGACLRQQQQFSRQQHNAQLTLHLMRGNIDVPADTRKRRRAQAIANAKECIRPASMPAQPIPGSQASPRLLANVMERKYLQGLPL